MAGSSAGGCQPSWSSTGQISRLFLHDSSPLARRIGPSYPLLSAARDLIAEKTFRVLRNGFAHWAFDWEVVGKDSYIVAYNWEEDLPTAKLHLEEADAFHILCFALIELVEDVLISERAFRPDAASVCCGRRTLRRKAALRFASLASAAICWVRRSSNPAVRWPDLANGRSQCTQRLF